MSDYQSVACPRCKSVFWKKHLEGQTKCLMCGRDLSEVINPPALMPSGFKGWMNGMQAYSEWEAKRENH